MAQYKRKGAVVLIGIDRGLNEVDGIEIRRLEWACYILRVEGEGIPSGKKILSEKFPKKFTAGKTRKKIEKVFQRVAL